MLTCTKEKWILTSPWNLAVVSEEIETTRAASKCRALAPPLCTEITTFQISFPFLDLSPVVIHKRLKLH